MVVVNKAVEVEVFEVGCCGAFVALTAKQMEQLRENHNTWYCPYGHRRWYPEETDAEKLKRQLSAAQDRVGRLETYNKDLDGMLTAETKTRKRLEKRAAAGVCHLCHRTFQNVGRHVKSKHPAAIK